MFGNKRAGGFGGDEERYGGEGVKEQDGEKPQHATAAQMAKRKIASVKPRRTRSESPAVFGNNASSFSQSSMTPPPASFTFGETNTTNVFNQNAQKQSNGPQENGTNMFGQNNTSFSSTFGAGGQQNGFTPPTSTVFNFASTQNGPSFGAAQNAPSPAPASVNPFSSFGNNNATVSTGFPAQPAAPSNPFSGFGFQSSSTQNDKQGEKPSNGLTFGASNTFGQSGSQPSTTNMFGSIEQNAQSTTQTPASNSNASAFGGASSFSQASNGNMFGGINKTSQSDSETPKAFGSASSIFGSNSTAASNLPKTNLFAQADQAMASQATPSASQNALSTFGQAKESSKPATNGSNGMFGAKAAESTPSFGGNMFSSAQTTKIPTNDSNANDGLTPSQPKTSNIFGGSVADNSQTASTASLFAPKPAGFTSFGQSAIAPTKTATNTNGQNGQTPFGGAQGFNSTPKSAASTPFTSATPSLFAQKPSGEATAVAEAPKSLFDRIDPEKTRALKDSQAKTSAEASKTSLTSGWAASSNGQSSLFKPATTPSFSLGASAASPAAQNTTTPRQNATSSTLFNATGTSNKADSSTSLLGGTNKSAEQPKSAAAKASDSTPQETAFRSLNQGFLIKLQTLDRSSDWTSFMDHYTSYAASIRKNINATAQTPRAGAGKADLFSKASSTVPPARKRPADAGGPAANPAPSATDKRSRTGETAYPKLPENSSSTSRLFAAALEKPKTPASSQSNSAKPTFAGFQSTSSNAAVATPSTAQKNGGFAPSFSTPAADNSTSTAAPKFGGFTPNAASKANSTTPATAQKTGGFVPNFGATGAAPGNFMAAFGKSAEQAEKEAKEKRKAEDYDSEEETLEDWEKRDAAEQAAKKAALAKSAQTAKSFTIAPTTTSKTTEAPKFSFASSTPTQKTTTSEAPATSNTKSAGNIFGFLSEPKQNDASTTPKTGGLFGASSSTSLFSTTPGAADATTPARKFAFGQSTSGANTPVTAAPTPSTNTKAEDNNSDGDAEEEAHEPPADLSALLPEEKENQDVLFELPQERKCRTYAVETNKEGKKAPVSKGIGKPYLLKSKITGRSRILFKIDTGKAVMNYDVVKGGKYGVTKKTVHGPFLDHIHSKEPKLTQFQLAFSSEEYANQLLKMLEESA